LLSRLHSHPTFLSSLAHSHFLEIACIYAHIAALCIQHTQVLQQITQFFKLLSQYSLFDGIAHPKSPNSTTTTTSSSSSSSSTSVSPLQLAYASYIYLSIDHSTYSTMWNWSPFLHFLSHPVALTRWYTCSALALLLHMNQCSKQRMIERIVLQHSSNQHSTTTTTNAHSDTSMINSTSFSLPLSLQEEIDEINSFHTIENAGMWLQKLSRVPASSSLTKSEGSTSSTDNTTTTASDSSNSTMSSSIVSHDAHTRTQMVSLGGIMIPRQVNTSTTTTTAQDTSSSSSSSPTTSPYISVGSTETNLQSIALALIEGRPILLEGSTGCGKSRLIYECANRMGLQTSTDVITLHIEQMDSKTLLGTYICTDIPGEFRWSAGVITQAVQQGCWLIIEDIDTIPFEILSALISLLEHRSLYLAGRDELILAHSSFQLFATRTISSSSSSSSTTLTGETASLLQSLFSRVYIHALRYDELYMIVQQSFSAITPNIITLMLQTFQLFSPIPNFPGSTTTTSTPLIPASALGSRRLSTRDFFKWCHRIQLLLINYTTTASVLSTHISAVITEEIFRLAMEMFVLIIPPPAVTLLQQKKSSSSSSSSGSSSSSSDASSSSSTTISTAGTTSYHRDRRSVMLELARIWNITSDRVDYYISFYKPQLEITSSTVSFNSRICHLSRNEKQVRLLSKEYASSQYFSLTKHALKLMEAMTMSIYLAEPILLVGKKTKNKPTIYYC